MRSSSAIPGEATPGMLIPGSPGANPSPLGTLTASTAQRVTLTAATASSGTAAYGAVYGPDYGPLEGTLTASDTRTGGPS